MTRDEGHGPLVGFTALAIAGAGTLAALALLPATAAVMQRTLALGLGLLFVGLALSLVHLGRKDRSFMAARGLWPVHGPGTLVARPSWISIEGALGVLTIAMGALCLIPAVPPPARPYIVALTGMAAAAFLLSVGQVYNIKGQQTWTGAAVWTPATGGLAFGSALWASAVHEPVAPLVVAIVAADTLVHFLRWRRVTAVSLARPDTDAPWFDRRHELLAARFLLLDAFPLISLFVWPSPVAPFVAVAGVWVDRFAFYALALPDDTEAEVARVERRLDDGTPHGL